MQSVAWSVRNGEVVVHFAGGDEGRNSEIRFTCDPAAKDGTPFYLNEEPVKQYNFGWRTAFACPVSPSKACSLNYGGQSYDLSSLGNDERDYISNKDGSSFVLNFCRSTVNSLFEGAVALEVAGKEAIVIANAEPVTIEFQSESNSVLAKYSGGYEGRRAYYYLFCNKNAGKGTPEYFSQSPGLIYNFVWNTSAVCFNGVKSFENRDLLKLFYHITNKK